jgi:hypothetical protein
MLYQPWIWIEMSSGIIVKIRLGQINRSSKQCSPICNHNKRSIRLRSCELWHQAVILLHTIISAKHSVHIQGVFLSFSCDKTILGLRRSHFLIISRPPLRYTTCSVTPHTSKYHRCKEGVPTRSHKMTDHLGVILWMDIMQQYYSLSEIFQNINLHIHIQAYCSNKWG